MFLALGRKRQEDRAFKASFSYIRPSSQNMNKKERQEEEGKGKQKRKEKAAGVHTGRQMPNRMKERMAEFKTNLGYTVGLRAYVTVQRALGFNPSITLVDKDAGCRLSQHFTGRGGSPGASLTMQ